MPGGVAGVPPIMEAPYANGEKSGEERVQYRVNYDDNDICATGLSGAK